MIGRTHGAPYRGYGYVPLRFGGGRGTSLGEWEHNNNNIPVVLGQAYRGLTGGFLLLRIFSVAISVSLHVCFILV